MLEKAVLIIPQPLVYVKLKRFVNAADSPTLRVSDACPPLAGQPLGFFLGGGSLKV